MIDTPAIFAWPVLVAQSLIFGTAAFALLLAPAPIEKSGCVTLWRVLAILNLVMSPLVFIEIAAGMAETSWRQAMPLIPEIMRETLAGRIWMWRFAAVVMLAIVVWLPLREELVGLGALVMATILIALGSLTSHAIDKGGLVLAIDFVHQAAAGLWFGALVVLLMSARDGGARFQSVTARVSMVCGWTVAVLAISGVLTAFQWFGWNLHLLFDSAYGRALMWKLAIAAPALLLGAYNRYWQVPKVAQKSAQRMLIRTVATECALLLVVLAWSAILANTPPPH